MAHTTSFKVVVCFAVCYLVTLSSGVGLIQDFKAVDENLNLRDSNVVGAVVPLDLKHLPRANPLTITVTKTVCEFSSTTLSKPSTTIWIPANPTTATTTSMPTAQTIVSTSDSTSEPSTTSSSHRTSLTSSSDASTPVPSSSEPPYAPPLSDSATGQGKMHFALLVWSLVMTGFMNV